MDGKFTQLMTQIGQYLWKRTLGSKGWLSYIVALTLSDNLVDGNCTFGPQCTVFWWRALGPILQNFIHHNLSNWKVNSDKSSNVIIVYEVVYNQCYLKCIFDLFYWHGSINFYNSGVAYKTFLFRYDFRVVNYDWTSVTRLGYFKGFCNKNF